MRNRTKIFLTVILLAAAFVAAWGVSAGLSSDRANLPSDGQAVAESPAADGGVVSDFVAKAAESGINFGYSYVMDNSKLKVTGGGEVTVQGNGYFLEGDGLRVWCDGESVWTYDVGAGEVVIEPADDANGLSVNPVLLVMNLGKNYTWNESGTAANFGGRSCRVYALSTIADTGLTGVKLYFSGPELIGAEMITGGVSLVFTISGLKFLPYDQALRFTPPPFPSDCVVTDLR